jgi:hypothetical protein
MHEPRSPMPTARPCSTPHSAPISWLRAGPPAGQPVDDAGHPEALIDPDREALIATVLADPDLLAEIVRRAPPTAFTPVLSKVEGRHDGWTGERMAAFLEALADTGIVTEACRSAGMSREAARRLRNRDPVFAAAHQAALSQARAAVADGLLERSITGTVEHYYRDGVLVGERRHFESWLALAVLRRLDKQAEQDRADASLAARIAGGWQDTLDALRSGGTAAVPAAVEPKVGEVGIPPLPASDPFENCWQAGSAEDRRRRRADGPAEGTWVTTFPPPPGFGGYENCPFDGFAYYERSCTREEAELIEAHRAAMIAAENAELLADAEAERDSFFAMLRTELASCQASRCSGVADRMPDE